MITVKQLLEKYDLVTDKEDLDSQRLLALAEQGLLDEKKIPMLKRAFGKNAKDMTMAEKKSLVETVDSLLSVVDSEVITEAKQNFLSKYDIKRSPKYPSEAEMPTIIILHRKAIRVFPDNQKVGLYYSQALDRYVSIPFGVNTKDLNPQINEETLNEVSPELATRAHVGRAVKIDKLKSGSGDPIKRALAIDRLEKKQKSLEQRMRTNVTDATGKNIRPWAGTDAVDIAKKASIMKIAANKKQKPEQHQMVKDTRYMSTRELSKNQLENPGSRPVGSAVASAISGGAPIFDTLAAGLGAKIGKGIQTRQAAKKAAGLFGSNAAAGAKPAAGAMKESFKERVAKKRQEKLDEALPLAMLGAAAARVALPAAGRLAMRGIGALGRLGGKAVKGIAKRVGGAAVSKALGDGGGDTGGGGSSEKLLKPITGATEHQFSQAGRAGAEVSKPQSAAPDASIQTATSRAWNRQAGNTSGSGAQRQVAEQSNFDVVKTISTKKNVTENLMFAENTVTINNRIAKKIMNVYESLNKENKAKVRNMINEDVVSFKKILNFAVRH